MAVGPTESLHRNIFQMTSFQVQISNQSAQYIQNSMRALNTVTVNPDTAIPPANSPQKATSQGIGARLDLRV